MGASAVREPAALATRSLRTPLAGPLSRAQLRLNLASLAAAASVALVPFWWHLTLVDPHIENITAVFSTVAIYPSDVCLIVLAATMATSIATRTNLARLVAAAALPVAAAISILGAADQTLAASVAAHLALLALAWLAVQAHARSSPSSAGAAIVRALVVSASAQAALAVAQFALQRPLVPAELQLPWLPGPDVSVGGTPVVLSPDGERLFRAFGTFPHPNILGGYLALALVSLPALQPRGRAARQARWLVGWLLLAGLVVAFSRAAWLAAGVGLGVVLLASRAPRADKLRTLGWSGLALAIVLVSPLAPTVRDRLTPMSANALERGSIENRLALDRDALLEMARHLPLGVGAGNFGLTAVADGYQIGWGEPAPNLALLIATELGLPGLVAMLVLVVGMLRLARARDRSTGWSVALGACCSLAVLAMLDHYLWTIAAGRVMAWAPLALLAARASAAGSTQSRTPAAPVR